MEANVFDRGRNLILSIAVVATAVGLPDLATSQQGIKGIVDTHAHLLPDASLSFDGALSEAVKVMDRYGIETTLIMSPPRSTAVKGNYEVEDLLAAVGKHPGRFRLMGGGGGLNRTLHGHADPSSVTAGVRDTFSTEARRLIGAGALGFGEMSSLHVSLSREHQYAFVPADHPLLLLLADIAAEEGVPIDLHCDALQEEIATPRELAKYPTNPKSMPATIPPLERLLAHNPRATIIWVHAGTDHLGDFTPKRIGGMLDRYPNLFVSLKIAPPRSSSKQKILSKKKLDGSWRELLIRHADRFVIGTDAFYSSPGAAGAITGFTEAAEPMMKTMQMVLSKLPAKVAQQIGRENARRLYGF